MNFQAQITEEISESNEKSELSSPRIRKVLNEHNLKCNVCGKQYENVNNLKVRF